MASQPGIEIPITVEAAGTDVTIERLAAKLLELDAAVQKLGASGKKAGDELGQGFAQGLGQKAFDIFSNFLSEIPGKLDEAVRASAAWADNLGELAQRSGFAVQTLQEFSLAAKTSGLNLNQLTRFSTTLSSKLVTNEAAFTALGLSAEKLAQQNPSKTFEDVVAKLQAIKDPAERAAKSLTLLGPRLAPTLQPFIASLEAAKLRSAELGLVVRGDLVQAMGDFNDELDTLKETQNAVTNSFGSFISADKDIRNALVATTNVWGEFNIVVKDAADLFHALPGPIKVAAAGLTIFGSELVGLVPQILSFAVSIKALGGFGAIGTAIKVGFVDAAAGASTFLVSLGPILLALAAIAVAFKIGQILAGFESVTNAVRKTLEFLNFLPDAAERAQSELSKIGPGAGLTGAAFTEAIQAAKAQADALRTIPPIQAEIVSKTLDQLKAEKELLGLQGQIASAYAARGGAIESANVAQQAAVKAAQLEFEIAQKAIKNDKDKQGDTGATEIKALETKRDLTIQIAAIQASDKTAQENLRLVTEAAGREKELAAIEVQINQARLFGLTALEQIAETQRGSIAAAQAVRDATVKQLADEREILKLHGERLAGNNAAVAQADALLAKQKELAEAVAKTQQVKILDAEQLRIGNEADAALESIAVKLGVSAEAASDFKGELHLAEEVLKHVNFDELDPDALDQARQALEDMIEKARKAGVSIGTLGESLTKARAASRADAGDKGAINKALDAQLAKSRAIEADAKLHAKTLKEVVQERVKGKTITQEEADKILPKAATNAQLFSEALSVAADAAALLGKNDFSNLVNGLLAAAAAGEQAAKAIKLAKDGGSKLEATIATAGAAAGVVGNILKGAQTQNAGKATLQGATQGAAFGSKVGKALFPVGGALVGGAIGAVAGGLLGFFGGSKFRKIAKDAGKVLGSELSDETVKKIQADSKKLGISIKSASLLNIGTAIADTGKTASSFGPQIQDLIKGIADKSIPAAEGMAELANSFSLVANEALNAGKVGDKALVGIIKQARASGVESPEIKAFVGEQLNKAVAGFNKFAALFKTSTKEEVDKLGKEADKAFAGLSDAAVTKLAANTGVIFGAIFNSLVSEQGIVGAVDQMKESFDTLKERLSKTLGPEAVNAILGPFGAAFDTIGNEKLRPIFDGIDGLSQAMQGLANAGFLTTDQFTALQQATGTLFDEAIAGGADMKTALTAVAPSIQAAISAAEQFGVPLDAATQKLKEQAEANGIAFKTDPQQQMLDVLTAIADVLGAKLPDSIKRTQAAVSGMADTSNKSFDRMSEDADGFVSQTGDRLREVAERTSVTMNDAAIKVTESFDMMAVAGQESFDLLNGGSDALALSLTEDIPLAAEEAIASLRELQNVAAEGVTVGGGGATGGTGGIKQTTANVSVNLGINENPLANAQTAAQMRAFTVNTVAEAIEDRIPSIISAVENN